MLYSEIGKNTMATNAFLKSLNIKNKWMHWNVEELIS